MNANNVIPPGSGAEMEGILQLWGKTGPNGTFHPALFHMLDVGNVARALLGPEAAPRFRRVLARVLNVEGTDALAEWLPLIVAMHDIGKVSSPFQGQRSSATTRAVRERLERAGVVFGATRGEVYRHQLISAAFVEREWAMVEPGLPRTLVLTIRDALGGHHGRFGSGSELERVRAYCQVEEPPQWAGLRADVYRALRERLAPGWAGGAAGSTPAHRMAATMALVGLTILCDWLGSDSARFPLAGGMALADYVLLSEQRARETVERVGFLRERVPVVYDGFAGVFPDRGARPLQRAIDELPVSALAAPGMFIIEAPTGEGKTEAALALARRLAAASGNDELYFGLPTTATSNQMFLRVHDFVTRAEGAPVKLVHGQAFLVEDDLLLRLRANGGDDAEGAEVIPTWFAPKKVFEKSSAC
jgi:CRISPR-associated endonuclease/helicase Cas3